VDRAERAQALIRATLSLGDASLRAAYVASVARAWQTGVLAQTLDAVCERAEQAEAASREALVAIVDALNADGMGGVVQALREQVAGEPLLALERLIRHPVRTQPPETLRAGDRAPRDAAAMASDPRLGRYQGMPADKQGRPLTLGERKSLARRTDRETLQKLFADPHPDVIGRLLRNPRLTEDDVVRLAAKRPGRGEVLAEVARSTRWVHRPRVRMSLVMNPATPAEIAARIVGLLLRPELELVAQSPAVPAALRALCVEHLERRPPAAPGRGSGRLH
jgi:hypothetical protein